MLRETRHLRRAVAAQVERPLPAGDFGEPEPVGSRTVVPRWQPACRRLQLRQGPRLPLKADHPGDALTHDGSGMQEVRCAGQLVERVFNSRCDKDFRGDAESRRMRCVAAEQRQAAPGRLRDHRRLRGLPAGGLPRGRALAPRDPEGRV